MQNTKTDPEKVLEAVLPELLSDEDFAAIQDCRLSSDASWVDFVGTSLRFTTLAMADPQRIAEFLRINAPDGEEA